MFQLDFYLKAHNAALYTTPGKTQLVKAGYTVCTVEENEYHSIFQAVDQHFCEKYKFLSRTNILQLANKRQITNDLEKQGGNVQAQFEAVHIGMEETLAKIAGTNRAPKLDIAAYIDSGEQMASLADYSAIVFTSATAARKYYYTYNGKNFPEDAELDDKEISLQPSSVGAAATLIKEIETIFDDAISFSNVKPKLRAFEGTAAAISVPPKSAVVKMKAAVEEVHFRWNQDPAGEEYRAAIQQGMSKGLVGASLNDAIWKTLPNQKTVGEYLKATVEALKNKGKDISCENKEFRFGPYGAATYILDNKDRLERNGCYLKKKIYNK